MEGLSGARTASFPVGGWRVWRELLRLLRGEGHNWEGVYGHSGNYIDVLGHSEYVGVEGWSWMGVGVGAYSHATVACMAPAIKVLACVVTATQGVGVYGESKSLDQPGVYGNSQDWVGVDIHAW